MPAGPIGHGPGMPMNVQPIPTLDDRINDIRMRTAEIVNEWILPNEAKSWNLGRNGEISDHDRREAIQLREEIKEVVWNAGLWAPHLPTEYGGMGLDFLAHAYMNEVLAYAIGAAGLFGVVAPNSGNQSILVKYGTEDAEAEVAAAAHRRRDGVRLLDDRTAQRRLDPRSLTTSAVLDGDEWVINGHKWFTSNGIDADFFIVMARVAEATTPAKRRRGRDGADHRADGHRRREDRPRHRRLGTVDVATTAR